MTFDRVIVNFKSISRSLLRELYQMKNHLVVLWRCRPLRESPTAVDMASHAEVCFPHSRQYSAAEDQNGDDSVLSPKAR